MILLLAMSLLGIFAVANARAGERAVGLEARGVDPSAALHNLWGLDVRDALGRKVSARRVEDQLAYGSRRARKDGDGIWRRQVRWDSPASGGQDLNSGPSWKWPFSGSSALAVSPGRAGAPDVTMSGAPGSRSPPLPARRFGADFHASLPWCPSQRSPVLLC